MKDTSGLEHSTGFTTKFSLGHDLTNFQKKFFEWFKHNEMDTITYLPDPANTTNMVNVIKDHTHFMQKYACDVASTQCTQYNICDLLIVDHAAHLMMLDSIDNTFHQSTEDPLPMERCTFIHAWMLLIQTICTDSVGHFDSENTEINQATKLSWQ